MRLRHILRKRTPFDICAWAGMAAAAAVAALAAKPLAPKFFPDDPITREPAPKDASHVEPFPIHLSWDIMSSLFVKQGQRTAQAAQDVNTIGEVPDSGWFVNRAGSIALTASDVARG